MPTSMPLGLLETPNHMYNIEGARHSEAEALGTYPKTMQLLPLNQPRFASCIVMDLMDSPGLSASVSYWPSANSRMKHMKCQIRAKMPLKSTAKLAWLACERHEPMAQQACAVPGAVQGTAHAEVSSTALHAQRDG